MEEKLIQQVMERTGVSREVAEKAAEAVISFLEEKLPDAVAGHVRTVAKGGSLMDAVGGGLGDKLGGLGGLFGKD